MLRVNGSKKIGPKSAVQRRTPQEGCICIEGRKQRKPSPFGSFGRGQGREALAERPREGSIGDYVGRLALSRSERVSCLREILNFDRLDLVGRSESNNFRVKIEL